MPGIAILLFVAILIFAVRATRAPEPSYHGRSLSLWVEQYRVETQLEHFDIQHEQQVAEARDAIRAIGTNGLPSLVAWAQYEPPLPGARFLSWAPMRLSHAIDRAFFNQARVNLAEGAMEAIVLLETNAAAAIPELVRLTGDTKHPAKARRAALTLNQLGPGALPAMLSAWSNAMPAEKLYLSIVIGSALPQNIRSRDQLPLLLPILQTHYEPLRSEAYEAVLRIAPELLTNTPSK